MNRERIEIVINVGVSAHAPAQLLLRGEQEATESDELFTRSGLNAAKIFIDSVQLEVGEEHPVDLQLATPVEIHRLLTKEIGSRVVKEIKVETKRLRTEDELNAAVDARILSLRDEALRRFAKIETQIERKGAVFLGIAIPAGGASCFAAAEIKLHLSAVLGGTRDPMITADVRAEIAATVVGTAVGITRRVSFICVISAQAAPTLGLELTDFQLSLPHFEMPGWTFPAGDSWRGPLKDQWAAASQLLRRLSQVAPAVTIAGPAQPALAIRRAGATLDWALVDPEKGAVQDGDWAEPTLNGKLASYDFTTTLGSPPTTLKVTGVTARQVGGALMLEGTITGSAEIGIPAGSRQLGPLEISWDAMKLAPKAEAGPPTRVEVGLAFDRLTIRVVSDPAATLSFEGELLFTGSGVEVVSLRLIEPYPIELIARGAAALARGAASVVRVVADFAKATAAQVAVLLDILGRIAVAVARAVAFAVGAAAELVGQALAALAEALGQLLKKLAALADDLTSTFTLELRIGIDPLELRQVLVTVRGREPSKEKVLEALGLKLNLAAGWKPGVLIDLVSQPGAYFVMTRTPAAADLATLSTDLWLKQENSSTPLRDVADNGGRPAEPLIAVKVTTTDKFASATVVVAGVRGGSPVLLKKLVGTLKPVPGLPVGVEVLEGPHSLVDLEPTDVAFDVRVKRDRILPLFGMGETGSSAPPMGGPSFLEQLKKSLGNVVWVKGSSFTPNLAQRELAIDLTLGLKAAGLESEITLRALLGLEPFDVSLQATNAGLPIRSRRREERALGLLWVIEQANDKERAEDREVEMFQMGFAGAQSGFRLNVADKENEEGKARMELRFDGLAADGRGVAFVVKKLTVGPGGLDLVAEVKRDPVRLNGINATFQFTAGRLEIRAGKLVHAAVEGKGSLPPDLVGDAACTLALVFGTDSGGDIVLQSGKVRIEKVGEPIVCRAMRFTLTITDLDIGIIRDGGYHFFFQVTGSLRFTPNKGEFERGLLQYLDGLEMMLERAPLAADPRVLAKHITFQKVLNPKKSFNLFNLFTFEVRSFGYHGASDKFGGDPALNIAGQMRFVEIGDVMQPSIEFHGLWMALPKRGESLPRIRADGLGVDLNLKGAIRVKGSVLAVDKDTKTVEGKGYVPEGYTMSGFLGTGELSIPGLGDFATNFGFVELERENRPGSLRHAFYLYGEKRRVAVKITTPIWVFYMREFGLGFGFRYTLEAIKAADDAGASVPKLIKVMDEVSKRQGDLHKLSAWRPDPEGDKVTLALKGAIQPYPTEEVYEEKREETAESPFFFDLVAAIRSDFTLFMGLRGWMGANYYDYEKNTDGMRENPGLRGYLYINPEKKVLLARALGDSRGYIGNRIASLAKQGDKEPILRRALRSIDWSATLLIKPGLFHYELGWPDQLSVRLIDEANMRVSVRGGMIFRVAEDGLLWAYNIEADAFFRFGGSVRAGSVGVSASATLDIHFVARVVAFLSWRFQGSLIYGLISLDATLSVQFSAWLRIDLKFRSFTITIRFGITLQLSAAVEAVISTNGFGAAVNARVGVSAFGRTLSVGIGFAINDKALAAARAQVQRFLAMSLTADEPDAAPLQVAASAAKTIASDAALVGAPAEAPPAAELANGDPEFLNRTHAHLGRPISVTDFWLLVRRAEVDTKGNRLPAGHNKAYAMLVPREQSDPFRSSFFTAPTSYDGSTRNEEATVHTIDLTEVGSIALHYFKPGRSSGPQQDEGFTAIANSTKSLEIRARWNAPVENDVGERGFTLAHLFDECFLYDAKWEPSGSGQWRKTTVWWEPNPRVHLRQELMGQSEEERVEERDRAQRSHLADQQRNEVVDGVHQARSTILAMFFDQFVTLARSGWKETEFAHVTDLGLVFYGPIEELENLRNAKVAKADAAGAGTIALLHRSEHWFEKVDPRLAPPKRKLWTHGQGAIAPEGVKLAWDLAPRFQPAGEDVDAEHYLEHYEIIRNVQGLASSTPPKRVKRADTIGPERDGRVELYPSDWQFVDDLSDGIPATMRRALLPPSDEAGALAAALAWSETFGDNEEIAITYSVAPCDISGTRGDPQGFVVVARRPQPAVRGAEAELRFVVTKLDDSATLTFGAVPSGGMGVVLAMKDESYNPAGQWRREVGGSDVTIQREYYLIADPEDIQPSGRYGSGGLTDRQAGSGIGFVPSRDQLRWKLPYLSTEGKVGFFDLRGLRGEVPVDTPIDSLESDRDTLKRFPLWRALAGKTGLKEVDDTLEKTRAYVPVLEGEGLQDFLARLWTRDGSAEGARIATRFWLETVQVVKWEGKTLTKSGSQPTPVAVELRIEPKPGSPAQVQPSVSRPEAFEWPVHLSLPPLGPAQVRGTSGFVQFLVPGSKQDFRQLLASNGSSEVSVVPDPLRRILTQVAFDVTPNNWQNKVGAAHLECIAGYDVHEVDIDDLAQLDTTAGIPFERDEKTWARARRVASIERVTRANAVLHPGDTKDWQGWQAHYPSETWRIENRAVESAGTPPLRARWYSAAESTLAFAERNPRLRFFPTLPPDAIPQLLAKGIPTQLRVTLITTLAEPEDAAILAQARAMEQLTLFRVVIADDRGQGNAVTDGLVGEPKNQALRIALSADQRKNPVRWISAALLGLGWKPVAKVAEAFRRKPTVLDVLCVQIAAFRLDSDPDDKPMATAVYPLKLHAFVHPLLEEVLGELEYALESEQLYRRYIAAAQSVQPIEAKKFVDFIGNTASETDPYGWSVLHQMGLAAAFTLYDRDRRRFLGPREWAPRVEEAFTGAIQRYSDAYPRSEGRILGQPFVDVLLKPLRDRVVSPFDEVKETGQSPTRPMRLDDEGLAVVQLALRPTPVSGRDYYRLNLTYRPGTWPVTRLATKEFTVEGVMVRSEKVIDGYELCFANRGASASYEVLRPSDGQRRLVLPNMSVTLPLFSPPPPGQWPESEAPVEMQLLIRGAPWMGTADGWSFADFVSLQCRVVTREYDVATKKTLTTVTMVSSYQLLNELNGWLINPELKVDEIGDLGLAGGKHLNAERVGPPFDLNAGESATPYERFAALTATEWAALRGELTDKDRAKLDPGTYEEKRGDSAVITALDSIRQNLRLTAPEMDWAQGDKPPGFALLLDTFGTYLPWSQRFLDHARAEGDVLAPAFSLAAPIKALPWRLASDVRGEIRLSFLHADRWAHARAYAVRPASRYDHLAEAAGWVAARDSEQLLPVPINQSEEESEKPAVGYALIVSPRTERIEPPVILGSRLAKDAQSGQRSWEVVLARHGEENLAFSNRPLFARLGTEGTAISFARAYRYPRWPEVLKLRGGPASAETYPEREAVSSSLIPSSYSGIDGAALAELSVNYPELYQGADILRIQHLLPHYRLTALAVARAGIVVSEIVTARQDEAPRRALPPLKEGVPIAPTEPEYEARAKLLLQAPTLAVVKDTSGNTTLRLGGTRLVSHTDVTESQAFATWLAKASKNDIGWWPDPDMSYTLVRRLRVEGFKVDEDETTISLLPQGGEESGNPPVPAAGIVRCRGKRFAPGSEPLVITHLAATLGYNFFFASDLILGDGVIGQGSIVQLPTRESDAVRDAFREVAKEYAVLECRHHVTVIIAAPPDFTSAGKNAVVMAQKARELLVKSEMEFGATGADPWPELLTQFAALRDIYVGLETEAVAADTPEKVAKIWDKLLHPLSISVNRFKPTSYANEEYDPATVLVRVEPGPRDQLTLLDLPLSDAATIDAIVATKHPIAVLGLAPTPGVVGKPGGIFWQLAAQLLLGNATQLVLRAVDQRQAIELVTSKPAEAKWIAPGEIEILVDLPEWAKWPRTL